ncbi:MAG: hypothetical protein JKY87_03140 [Mariprofundus sp.]|nr:hypothetical protein [Mariprofundus sp.]
MKIHHNLPISGKTTQKSKRSSATGAFGQVLESQAKTTPANQNQSENAPQPNLNQAPMQEAWHTLETSVSLLDEAMHCIESGDNPPQQLIHDIEQLRALLRQQVSSGNAALELKQADTLLAVEAERIRAMQS